jgi:LPXTG-motif cell wall-anchored protein
MAPAPVAEPEPVVLPAAEEVPVVLAELPRTGTGTRPAVLTGALLLVLGRLATVVGRRRQALPAPSH